MKVASCVFALAFCLVDTSRAPCVNELNFIEKINSMVNSDQLLIDKLRFWHKLEFFIPYDLDGRAQERENQKKLWRAYDDTTELRFSDVPTGFEVARYTLFLGVFDKGASRVVGIGRTNAGADEDLEEETRADLEGRTCMASIELNAEAEPLIDTFQVSTLPWALGQSRKHGLSTLSSAAFRNARERLAQLLHNFNENRRPIDPDDGRPNALAPGEVDQLIALLSRWSDFSVSKQQNAALLEVTFRKQKSKSDSETGAAEDDEEDELPQIGILNSFFIEDIEAAMAVTEVGDIPKALRQYLTPLPQSERLDLYSDLGRQHIWSAVAPANINAGRWFSNPEHAMSVMQQFAINTGLQQLRKEGLFSVNGPPGTGKTTLLRDIISDNIVRRAAILAKLPSPADALVQQSGKRYRYLIPELTGFEMVVASSNNAAVENISKELPQTASVSPDDIAYLRPVAHKLAAQQFGGECRALSSEDRPWGLIAAAMGKKANRSAFIDRVFSKKIDENTPKTWSGEERPLNLWQWRNEGGHQQDHGLDFAQVQKEFEAAQKKVSALLATMQSFHDLIGFMRDHDEESWCRPAKSALEDSQRSQREVTAAIEAAEAERAGLEDALSELVTDSQLIESTKPAWWRRLTPNKDVRDYRTRLSENAQVQLALRRAIRKIQKRLSGDLKENLTQARLTVENKREDLKSRKASWAKKQSEYAALLERFHNLSLPDRLDDLQKDDFQIEGLWHTAELAKLRSELFKQALRLHEAWLYAVSQKGGGFGGNLFEIQSVLDNTFNGNAQDRLALWQSLFMVVPVISSTFASFARQFEDVGTNGIGWLFIDEAGQAVPQAAVGALLRSKRAFVIGDPLHIEPVFTLPKKLILKLAKLSHATEAGDYSPDQVSAQVLADRANAFGTMAETGSGNSIWIGSPLRVHRRCIDPMFSIANKIAYEDRMVFGLKQRSIKPDQSPYLGQSCWIDLPGTVAGRQSVPEQNTFVAQLIARFFGQFDALPEIYIISPFKEVKEELIRTLKSHAMWTSSEKPPPPRKQLQRWSSMRIGTVHTFQGKQEDTVFLVLGADKNKESAAKWAASKPNIFNVALTRAKRRFYIVGDRDLWGTLRYFQEAYRDLPTLSATAFEQRARQAWSNQAETDTSCEL